MVSFTPPPSLPAARKEHPLHSPYGLLKRRKIPTSTGIRILNRPVRSTVLNFGLKIKLLRLFSTSFLPFLF